MGASVIYSKSMNSLFQQLTNFACNFPKRFIPEEIKHDTQRSRAAYGVLTLAILAGIAVPLFALVYMYLGFAGGAAIVLAGGLAMSSTLLILRYTGRLAFAREFFIASFFVMKVWLAYFLGGIESPTMPWLLLCPMISMAFGGVRQGALWGGIITSTVLVIFLLQTFATSVFPVPVIVDQRLLQMVSMLGLFIFSAIVVWFFRSSPSKTVNFLAK